MNVAEVTATLARLRMLKYFPADKNAHTALVGLVCSMATTEDQVRWLVRRTLALYNEWPGPLELRAVFCSKYPPRDGINAYSQIYEDGIPSEKPQTYQGIAWLFSLTPTAAKCPEIDADCAKSGYLPPVRILPSRQIRLASSEAVF